MQPWETVTAVSYTHLDVYKRQLQKILVADSSKFGQVRPGYFAELEEIDEIVTDDGLSREWQDLIAEKDIPLHLV